MSDEGKQVRARSSDFWADIGGGMMRMLATVVEPVSAPTQSGRADDMRAYRVRGADGFERFADSSKRLEVGDECFIYTLGPPNTAVMTVCGDGDTGIQDRPPADVDQTWAANWNLSQHSVGDRVGLTGWVRGVVVDRVDPAQFQHGTLPVYRVRCADGNERHVDSLEDLEPGQHVKVHALERLPQRSPAPAGGRYAARPDRASSNAPGTADEQVFGIGVKFEDLENLENDVEGRRLTDAGDAFIRGDLRRRLASRKEGPSNRLARARERLLQEADGYKAPSSRLFAIALVDMALGLLEQGSSFDEIQSCVEVYHELVTVADATLEPRKARDPEGE